MVHMFGALAPDVGVGLMNRLDAETDRLRRAAAKVGEPEEREAYAADALVGMLTGSAKTKTGRSDVVFVCDLAAYRRGHAEGSEVCHIMGGGPVPVSVVADIVDDAFVKAVVTDGTHIDTVVHYGRHMKAELRTALELGSLPDLDGVSCATAVAVAITSNGITEIPWPTAGPPRSKTFNLCASAATRARPTPIERQGC